MSITSKELASILGVSTSAVSMALNGRKGISDATRNSILKAAEEYGIKRESRKSSRSFFINLVIFKKHGMVYGDTPFFSAVLEGISEGIRESGYNLQVSYFYDNQDISEQIKMLALSDCAGIILLATEMLEDDIKLFQEIPQPLVVLDSYFEIPNFNTIVINNQLGAFIATKYLIDCGHRSLGHVASSVEINNFRERGDGFKKAVYTSAFYKECSCKVIRVGSTQDSAYNDMSNYLNGNPQLPSALFIDNDIIAISCIRALKEHGYRIPNDVSIIGFDDLPVAYVTSPKLTTVNVPKELMGRYAVSRLLEIIKSDEQSSTIKISINTSLVIRDTVKKINEYL